MVISAKCKVRSSLAIFDDCCRTVTREDLNAPRPMPFDDDHYKKLDERTTKAILRLVPCMNDTKWREVFRLICRHQLRFQIAWVRDSEWNTKDIHVVRESLIDVDGLRDPGIGGPCHFREILWIRVPKEFETHWGLATQLTHPFLNDLASLGSIPVTENESCVEIRGYQDLS